MCCGRNAAGPASPMRSPKCREWTIRRLHNIGNRDSPPNWCAAVTCQISHTETSTARAWWWGSTRKKLSEGAPIHRWSHPSTRNCWNLSAILRRKTISGKNIPVSAHDNGSETSVPMDKPRRDKEENYVALLAPQFCSQPSQCRNGHKDRVIAVRTCKHKDDGEISPHHRFKEAEGYKQTWQDYVWYWRQLTMQTCGNENKALSLHNNSSS